MWAPHFRAGGKRPIPTFRTIDTDLLCEIIQLQDERDGKRPRTTPRDERALEIEQYAGFQPRTFVNGIETVTVHRTLDVTPSDTPEMTQIKLDMRVRFANARKQSDIDGTPISKELIAEAMKLGVLAPSESVSLSTDFFMTHCDTLVGSLRSLGAMGAVKNEISLMAVGSQRPEVVSQLMNWVSPSSTDMLMTTIFFSKHLRELMSLLIDAENKKELLARPLNDYLGVQCLSCDLRVFLDITIREFRSLVVRMNLPSSDAPHRDPHQLGVVLKALVAIVAVLAWLRSGES